MTSGKRQSGLTLVELMVAIAIALMVLAAMSQAFINTSRTRSELDNVGRQVENGRYAVTLLSNDLKLAGFYGEFAGVGATVVVPADVCATASLDDLGWLSGSYPVHVTGFRDASPSCVTGRKSGTDVIVIRRVSTEETNVSGAAGSSGYFLQTSGCSTEPDAPVVGRGNASPSPFIRTRKDCTTPSGLREFLIHVYYIAAGTGNQVTLQRREFSGGVWSAAVALVDGIEDLRIEYAVDTDGDGAPNQIGLNAAAINSDCSASPVGVCWENVVSATLHLLSRNPERTAGHSDDKTYRLGAATLGPFNDAFKRHAYSVTVPFVNPAGRRE